MSHKNIQIISSTHVKNEPQKKPAQSNSNEIKKEIEQSVYANERISLHKINVRSCTNLTMATKHFHG